MNRSQDNPKPVLTKIPIMKNSARKMGRDLLYRMPAPKEAGFTPLLGILNQQLRDYKSELDEHQKKLKEIGRLGGKNKTNTIIQMEARLPELQRSIYEVQRRIRAEVARASLVMDNMIERLSQPAGPGLVEKPEETKKH